MQDICRLLLWSWILSRGASFQSVSLPVKKPHNERGISSRTVLAANSINETNANTNHLQPCDNDPDLRGVHVDGFPLPPIPTRDNDQDFLAALHNVPVAPIDDVPLKARDLTTNSHEKPLRVLIAGGGLGGLALASTLIRQGNVDVHIFEQARQYRPFGGPIQLQSNALWALQQINPLLYEAVEECGVRTGDRLSGIKDGLRCQQEGWLVKFDAASPALRCGLPLTLAINRVALQDIFLKYGCPRERVHTANRVLDYTDLEDHGVAVHLEDGSTVFGDILIGADGIWSRCRHAMHGLPLEEASPEYATRHARYSGYTCYTGTCQHTPADIDSVAYKVFLGQQQYFGCTDTGHGWQHWWAFLPVAPGGANQNPLEVSLDHLIREFEGWSPEIHDLFQATKPEVIKRRDLYDRFPLPFGSWTRGYCALLGDAAHPTMPNLGQGGAMAMEDAYVLGEELKGLRHTTEIPKRLQRYERRRYVRASIAQFLSRNGSDLLVDWEKLRNTPIVGPIAMWSINLVQPLTMDYLYSADF